MTSDGHGRPPNPRLLAMERAARLLAEAPELDERLARFFAGVAAAEADLAEHGARFEVALSPMMAEAQKVYLNAPFWERAATEPTPRPRVAEARRR